MSAVLLRGRRLAQSIYADIKDGVSQLADAGETLPCIAAVRIGNNKDARGYAQALAKAAGRAGFAFRSIHLPASSDVDSAVLALQELNSDSAVAGILLLTPLPAHLQPAHLHWQIDPYKDIDGTHPENLGRLMTGARDVLFPATPAAGMALLQQAALELKGKSAVVIGRSVTVGKPLALLLLEQHCTVTVAHSRTEHLAEVASKAEILCVATGQPHMVTGNYVRPGAVVLDFGTTYTENGITGDCEPESVVAQAGAFTPVPGGIGPLTNAMLMRNALQAIRNTRLELIATATV